MPLSRRKLIKSGLFLLTGVALADVFWMEQSFIETNEFYIGSATKHSANIKVVQISDLHIHSINHQLTRLAKKLNKIQPDLILITGDAIDNVKNGSILNDFLQLIDKSIKKVAVLGNWEYWGQVDLTELGKIYTDNNGSLLINQTVQYSFRNQTISITGLDDFVGGKAELETALKEYTKSDHHIILSHCPRYRDFISEHLSQDIPVDFILSGHTHGGQINFFGFVPFLPQGSGGYIKGWYTDQKPDLYVSKGVGTSIFPARFGARAEIALFNLTS